jgi:hypothetical protein
MYTTPLPCIGSSEIDSKLFTNFEFFVKEKNHKYLKNTLIYKAKQVLLMIFFLKRSLHILEDGASNVQVEILAL